VKILLYSGLTALTLATLGCDRVTKEVSTEETNYMSCRNDVSEIVNGSTVAIQDPDSKRAVLLIIRSGDTIKGCTGSVISNRIILTAAHCVEGANKDAINVVFHPDMSCQSGYNTSKTISSVDYIKHENYSTEVSGENDLALIKLASPVPGNYHPQALFDGKSTPSSDDVLMIGYGVTDSDKEDSLTLRKVTKSYLKNTVISGQGITFVQLTSGVCSGDSGGPLYVQVNGQYKIIGVNSIVMGPEYAPCRYLSQGMYIPHFTDWIEKNINQLESQ